MKKSLESQTGLRHVMDRAEWWPRAMCQFSFLGETGTGKEVVSRGHSYPIEAGKRPFIRVNCVPFLLTD